MTLKPLSNRVIIFPTNTHAESVRESGLITLETEAPPSTEGTIVAIGSKVSENISIGDVVKYSHNSGAEIEWEGKTYLIMRDTELICVI